MSKIIAVIPARSGSKGIPNKNIKLLAGYPLIAYAIRVAQLTKAIDRVIVSTDSEEYAAIARRYGAEVPFLRPPEISGDDSTDYEFIEHLVDWLLCSNKGSIPEYLIHLRPNTPLRESRYIDMAIEQIIQNGSATALRSVHEMSQTAYKTFEIDGEYLKSIGSGSFDLDMFNAPRQRFEKTYYPNGYVDIIKTKYVLENKKLHGNRVIAYITPYIVDVDIADDFNYLEYQVVKESIIVNKLFKKES